MMAQRSHKDITPDGSRLLRLYYTNRSVLFIMCAANELFFASLYMVSFMEGYHGEGKAALRQHRCARPRCSSRTPCVRTIVRIGQWTIGCWWLILYVTMPLCILKQIISIVQMLRACVTIAEADQREREQRKRAKAR